MLHVHLGNRVERLAERLGEVVRPPLANPFAQECIVVQSQGMQRWLEMELAGAMGVWANGWFPFPDGFARKLRRDILGETGPERPMDRPALAWSIAAAIAAARAGDPHDPAYAPLGRYLRLDDTPSRLIALAERIADVFDGYQLYRPDLLLAWEAGETAVDDPDDAWQPALWRAIVARHAEGRANGSADRPANSGHAARQAERLIGALEGGTRPRDPDFERISVFGLSALSPLYVRLLSALARHREVHVFALAASAVDWGRLSARPDSGRMHGPRAPDAAAAVAPAAGHPLLRSLGHASRDFQMLIAAVAGDVAFESGPASETGCVLHALQADLDADRARPRPALLAATRAGTDASVTVHACHGPMREVEVLRDQLVDAFATLPSLEPHQVVVMTPDIAGYAPYVEAVFGASRLDGLHLPFRIADRPSRDALTVVHAFGRLLHVLRGRFAAPEVVDLLALPPIRARFGLDAADIEAVRAWVAAAGIRWAADAEHRRSVAQPAERANTWRFGLDRLLLGYAVGDDAVDAGADETSGSGVAGRAGGGRFDGGEGDPGAGFDGDAGSEGLGGGRDDDGADCFLGVLPALNAIGAPACLGALNAFVARLTAARTTCVSPRSARDWATALTALLAETVALEVGNAWQHARLQAALDALVERAEAAGLAEDLTLDCVTDQVLQAVDAEDAARGFLSGGITVCALAPMRSIPFRVVALLGMNDGVFPRAGRPFAFDLVARTPRLGDRRARDDDRFLFLEALLAARDRLVITFSGQSVKDNARLPPSVVVSELLDALDALDPAARAGSDTGAAVAAGIDATAASPEASDGLITWHPLQPFSPRYFGPPADRRPGDARLFSYAGAYVATAATMQGARTPRRPFLAGSMVHPRLTDPADPADQVVPPETINLSDLIAFFRHPARFFLQRRLGIAFPGDETPLEDREPLLLDPLARYGVGDRIVRALLAGRSTAAAVALVRAEGVLPLGVPGEVMLTSIVAQAEAIAEAAAPLLAEPAREPIDVDLALPGAGVRLVGTLRGVRRGGLVRRGFARVGADKELDVWIEHLVLNALVADGTLDGAGDGAQGGAPDGPFAPPHGPVLPVSRRVGRPPSSDRRSGGAAVVRYGPVAEPLLALSELASHYVKGQTAWLPFLPRTSYAFAAAAMTGAASVALQAARRSFEPPTFNDGSPGDGQDPFVRLVLGDAEPFADEADGAWRTAFAACARAVYEPLLAARIPDDAPAEEEA